MSDIKDGYVDVTVIEDFMALYLIFIFGRQLFKILRDPAKPEKDDAEG